MAILKRITIPLPPGKISTALAGSVPGADISEVVMPLDCDAILVSAFVSSVTGTFDLAVYTETEPGKSVLVDSFPTISSPSGSLVVRKSSDVLGNLRLVATTTGACTYEVRVKGLSAGDPVGPIPVTVVSSASTGTPKSIYDESLAVAASGTADIITYTVPVAKTAYLMRLEVSGSGPADYSVLLNGSPTAKARTYWASGPMATVEFGEDAETALKIVAGDVLIVRVSNWRPTVNDFEARLQYIEV